VGWGKGNIFFGGAFRKAKYEIRRRNPSLELARQFILAAQQAKIIALQENPVAGRDFLKRIGSPP